MQNNFVSNKSILVTGANGQLGSELRQLAPHYPHYQFLFTAREDLPIDNFEAVKKYFVSILFVYIIIPHPFD